MIKIYCLTNKVNGKKYIGQTKRYVSQRVWRQVHEIRHGELSKALREFGKENFMDKVLKIVETKEQADELEAKYIKKLNTAYPNGYNLQLGGKRGYAVCEELRKRMSESHKGNKPTKETLKRMSESQKIAQLEPSIVEAKRKRMMGNKYTLGIAPWNKGLLNFIGKKIICNETKNIYSSIQEASRQLGIDGSGIVKVIKGKRNHCGGYTFNYI